MQALAYLQPVENGIPFGDDVEQLGEMQQGTLGQAPAREALVADKIVPLIRLAQFTL